MLKLRIATGIVGIPLVVLLIWTGDRWFAGVVAAILLVATLEFQTARGVWLRPLALIAAASSAALAVAAHAGGEWMNWFLIGVIVIPLIWVTLFSETSEALPDWLWTVGSVLYLGWLGCHLDTAPGRRRGTRLGLPGGLLDVCLATRRRLLRRQSDRPARTWRRR